MQTAPIAVEDSYCWKDYLIRQPRPWDCYCWLLLMLLPSMRLVGLSFVVVEVFADTVVAAAAVDETSQHS